MTGVLEAIRAALPSAGVEVQKNPGPCAQDSLAVSANDARAVAEFLRDSLGYDFCSNVSGVDWPARKVKEEVVHKESVEGVESDVKEIVEREIPGYLEAVYHLYSIAKKSGPLTVRVRTGDRKNSVTIPSLTPVWKSADFQEREAFDLFGIHFEGHPDLRRILMWDEFADFPMRKDYVPPDDFEYEPTPHDEILAKVKARTEAA
jgi:NADH-quinone oxidoreductase subunit C